MGLDTSKYAFVDIYGLDDELLSMVPQPVEAVLCLFPVTNEYEKKRLEEDSKQAPFVGPEKEGEVIWFKQTIGNACGTIGLLHSIANTSASKTLSASSPFAELLKDALPLNANDRAAYLQTSKSLSKAHTTAAASGQTVAPPAETKVDLHFISFIRESKTQQLFELDGRRVGPVNREVKVPRQEDLLKVATQWVADNYVSPELNQPGMNHMNAPADLSTDEFESRGGQLQPHCPNIGRLGQRSPNDLIPVFTMISLTPLVVEGAVKKLRFHYYVKAGLSFSSHP